MRLTRDGDITVDLETEDPETIPDLVLSGIGSREKSRPLRMQCSEGLPKQFEDQIKNSLKLENDQLLASMTTFCLQGLWSVVRKAGEYKKYDSSLEYPSFKPSINKAFRWPSDVFGKISQRDLILHHPYDAFES
jgi:polyphosphate kinase